MLFKLQLIVKLTVIILLVTFLQVSASSNAQTVSISVKNISLSKLFKDLRRQTGYNFLYNSRVLNEANPVSLSVNNVPLKEALDKCFADEPLTYVIHDNNVVIQRKPLPVANTAISFIVTGVIKDVNGIALPGVTIREKGTTVGISSKADGSYSLKITDGNAVLIFSFIGFETLEVPVNNQSNVNVVLKAQKSSLSEIIVVGYGTRQKKDITTAISTIGTDQIEKSTAISPELALQGQAAGVQVTSAGGDPSARPTIRIRGVSTFNSADPLYVVDGIPIAEGGAGATFDNVNDGTRRTPINIFTIINPDDIESISVLKDAAAAAVYGVRAANGVILITTKTGKKGHLKVDLDLTSGVQNVPKTFKVLNTQQYAAFYNTEYNANPQVDGKGNPVPIGKADFFGPVWDPASSTYLGNSPTYNWQDALIHKDAALKNYNLRVSGANDNTSYNLSGGYAFNDGSLKDVSTERYSLASNVVSKIGKYIEAGMNVRLVQENINKSLGADGDLVSGFKAAPWQPIYDPTNQFGYAPLYKLTTPITPSTFDYNYLYANRQYVEIGNALGAGAASSNTYVNQTILGNVYVQIQPVSGLKIKGTYSGQQYQINNYGFSNFNAWQFSETPGNPYNGAPTNLQLPGVYPNAINTFTGTTQNTVKSVNADYTHNFGKHNIDITLDASQQKYTWVTTSGSTAIAYSDPALRYYSASGAGTVATYSLNGDYSLIGYLARVSYNYNSKFYLDGVVRYDGSSRFAPGHQFGTFPSGSAAWRISQEDFLKSFTWLNDLKIRGGYGLLGNEQTTGGFKYSPIAGVNPPSYNLGTGVQTNNQGINFPFFPNTNLTWEKIYKADIGFDASLFNNSLSITIDYFHDATKGIIQSVSLVPSSGIQGLADLNIADVLNRGFEFQVNYNKKYGEVGINLSANLTTVHNEVTKLVNNQDLPSIGLQVGKPIGFIYGYKVGGIFQNQAEVTAWQANHKDVTVTSQSAGDIYFQDIAGQPAAGSSVVNHTPDGKIDANDQTYLGSTIPGFYYGFSVGANYKGFDFSAFFQGVGDVQKYDNARAQGESMNGYGRNQWVTVLNAWTQQNLSTTMPRAVYNDPANNNRVSNRFVESAAYLRFQNAQIGYTVPKQWIDATKVFQNLRVFVSGINLFTATKWKGIDPENDFTPSTRQFLFGVKAGF